MSLKYGFQSKVGIGEETTYGTAVTPTDFVEFTNEILQVSYAKRAAQGINTTSMHKKILTLGQTVAGDISFEVNPDDGLPLILKALFGKAPVSAQVGTSAYYTHTFIGADDWITDGSAGCGLTLQATRDDVAVDYSGCLPSTLNLVAAVGDALKATAGFVGQQAATQGSPTAASFSTLSPLVFHQGVVARAGGSIDVSNFTLNIDNGVKADTFKLGQTYIKRPARGMRVVTGSVQMYFEDSNIYDAFVANTTNEVILTFTSGSYSLTITLGNVYWLNNPTPNVGSPDVLTYTAPFQAYYDDATDQDIKIALVNTATSY